MSEAVILNDYSFNGSVAKGNWVVDFWAEWCGPCKIMAPHFDSVAKDLKHKIGFGKLNVDDNIEVAQKFEIMSIPTLLFFKDGEVVHSAVGALNKEQLKQTLEEVFN
jgi:thioredoxin 1